MSAVRLVVQGDRIELDSYEPGATLGDLIREVERFRLGQRRLITSRCAGCGECCDQRIPVFAEDMDRLCASRPSAQASPEPRSELLERLLEFPAPPDMLGRESGIRNLMRDMGMSAADATEIYEYNQAEPIVLRRGEDGCCGLLRDGYCTIYRHRPLTCRLWVCNMGERLSVLQERTVTEGTWHAYRALGWTAEANLSHNAFLAALSAWDLPLERFDSPRMRGGDAAVDEAVREPARELFFYF